MGGGNAISGVFSEGQMGRALRRGGARARLGRRPTQRRPRTAGGGLSAGARRQRPAPRSRVGRPRRAGRLRAGEAAPSRPGARLRGVGGALTRGTVPHGPSRLSGADTSPPSPCARRGARGRRVCSRCRLCGSRRAPPPPSELRSDGWRARGGTAANRTSGAESSSRSDSAPCSSRPSRPCHGRDDPTHRSADGRSSPGEGPMRPSSPLATVASFAPLPAAATLPPAAPRRRSGRDPRWPARPGRPGRMHRDLPRPFRTRPRGGPG